MRKQRGGSVAAAPLFSFTNLVFSVIFLGKQAHDSRSRMFLCGNGYIYCIRRPRSNLFCIGVEAYDTNSSFVSVACIYSFIMLKNHGH